MWAQDGNASKTPNPFGIREGTPQPDLRLKHQDEGEYGQIDGGRLFVKGDGDRHFIDPSDVKQGAVGDCYLLAAVMSIARCKPDEIEEIVRKNNDGTFDVRLFDGGKETFETVSNKVPVWSEPTDSRAYLTSVRA